MKKFPVLKFLTGILLGVTIAALVAFNSLLIWVASGPRSLERFTPYIEKALAGESDVRAKIGQTWLIWDGWQHPIDLRLKDVSLLTSDGEVFSKFPEISLGVDLFALPFGEILPTSLSVAKPIVSLKQNPDKSIGFGGPAGDGKITSTGETLSALIESLINPHSKSSLRKLETIELLGADFSIGNDEQGVILAAPDTTLILRKESSTQIKALLRTVLKYGEQESAVEGQVAYNKRSKRLECTLATNKLRVDMLSQMFTDNAILTGLKFPVSGKATVAVTEKGVVDSVHFAVDGGRGRIVHEKLDGEMPVNNLHVEGSATKELTNIVLTNIKATLAGSDLLGTITVAQTDKGIGVSGEASLANVTTDQAHLFWPLGLAPLTREWVTTNIHGGTINKASVILNIKPGDRELPLLPKEAIDATVDLKDAKIKYLQGHPEVRGVDALIKVDGIALDAAVSSAQAFTDTKLSNGRVYIADLNPDNPLIEVSMHADAPAKDIVTLLGLPMLEHAKHLNLEADKASGRATGDAKVGFYFFAKDEQGKDLPLTYEVKAKMSQVGAPAFLKRFDIDNASGDLAINEKAIEYTGSGSVNGVMMESGSVRYDLMPGQEVDTTIEATANINDEALGKFGVHLPVGIDGSPKVTFAAKLATRRDAVSFPSFSVKGQDVNVIGNMVLTPDGKDLDKLKLTTIHYGRTELDSLDYAAIPGGYTLKFAGASLDLRSMFEKKGSDFSFENFPAMDLDMNVKKLYGANKQTMDDVKARIVCGTRCTMINASGKAGAGVWSFTIKSQGKGRTLKAQAADAGAMLKGLGIYENMEGGAMALGGSFQDSGDSVLKGELRINDYVLRNAPVLAKILSLTSLTGFFDTLTGNGIGFKKLSAPFTLSHDVITLKDARTYGSAMGITADGTMTFPATELKIDGTIVPSYTLNNVVGKVPVLGALLTGGEGQGLFAANYSVKGKSDDPEVSVNPLSILTPGFLRHIFD